MIPSPASQQNSSIRPTSILRRHWRWGVKLAITLAFVWLVAAGADWKDIFQRLAGANVWLLFLAVICMAIAIAIAGVRWSMIARGIGATLPAGAAVRLVFIGVFFGQVLPATVGGDVVRGWLAVKRGLSMQIAAGSIFLDRLSGLLGLAATILVGLPFLVAHLPSGLVIAAGGAGVAVIMLLVAVLNAHRIPYLANSGNRNVQKVMRWLGHCQATTSMRGFLAATLLSVLIQTFSVFAAVFIARALGLAIDALACLVVLPSAMLIAMLPISVNGWGLREGAMVTGMTLLGFPRTEGLILSLLVGLATLVASIPGGVMFFVGESASGDRDELAEVLNRAEESDSVEIYTEAAAFEEKAVAGRMAEHAASVPADEGDH